MTVRRWLGLAILLGWIVSLAAPVASLSGNRIWGNGLQLLLIGWLGFLMFIPAWLANFPIMGIGLALLLGRQPPKWLGIITAFLASTALFWRQVPGDVGSSHIGHYHFGYWLWIATGWLCLLATRQEAPEPDYSPVPNRHFGE